MKLILVVEDEYGNAEVMQLLLEAAGYRVVTASNGQAALEVLSHEKPALILSDFMMPTMNGGEFGMALRQQPEPSQIPLVFMSGTSETVVRRTFRDYDAFLQKPFHVDALLDVVARLIEHGRPTPPSSEQVGDSMRHLLKGIHWPPQS
jgi:CheY-like chemotaxis protein